MSQAIRVRIYLFLVISGALYVLSPLRIGVVLGESMSPSLKHGQVYALDRTYYGRHGAKRGDVIVFDHGGVTYVKRVIAGPGESVYLLRQRDLSEDDLVMDWQVEYLKRLERQAAFKRGVHLVEQPVPEGFCFVVGDHLSRSTDSRAFGLVPMERVRGKMIAAPPAPARWYRLAGNYRDSSHS